MKSMNKRGRHEAKNEMPMILTFVGMIMFFVGAILTGGEMDEDISVAHFMFSKSITLSVSLLGFILFKCGSNRMEQEDV